MPAGYRFAEKWKVPLGSVPSDGRATLVGRKVTTRCRVELQEAKRMGQQLLPSRMSVPEVMGDPCASKIREHALALLRATESSERLLRSHPAVAGDLDQLRKSVERFASSVLDTLAGEAGVPAEGESISRVGGPMGDYRIDRSSGCWIWMRSVNRHGYPLIGRKANGRENVPAKIYWMLSNGPLEEEQLVVRTCGARLCVNPDHARITDRGAYGAEKMRAGSPLDWLAVHEIRATLCASREGLHRRSTELAERFGVSEDSVLAVFRNQVWFDADYVPGFEVKCAGPSCEVVFRTTSTVRRYHRRACHAAAVAARIAESRRRSTGSASTRSPERQAREEAALRAEAAAAEAEWSDVIVEEPRVSVWSVASIDQPIGEGGVLQDVLTGAASDGDPPSELERMAVREVLDDLTEEAVAAMDEDELAVLRRRLIDAHSVPSTSRAVAS